MKVLIRGVSLLLIIILWAFPLTSSAEEINIVMEGENLQHELLPIIKEGKTFIADDDISKVWGIDFTRQNNKTLIGNKGDTELHIHLEEDFFVLNRRELFEDVPSKIVDDQVYIPFRSICEVFDYNIKWDRDTRTATLIESDESKDDELNEDGSEEKEEEEEREEQNTNEDEGNTAESKVVSTDEGIASWYGSKFHGNNTSSGETYNMYEKTAAHRTLPFGTIVRVTFLQTGKSTEVRINDRGPHVQNRIIDLSKGAAEAIGLRAHGIGEVRMEVLEK